MDKKGQGEKFLRFCITCLFLLAFICHNSFSQYYYNYIFNGSLNGIPGVGSPHFPFGWGACDSYSSPDMFKVFIPDSGDIIYPVKDSTFIFLRARSRYHTNAPGPFTYEYMTQRLRRPLKKDSTYLFGLFYCFNSHDTVQDNLNPNILYPVRLELWAGNDSCAHEKLLMQTEPLPATFWTERHCTFKLTDTSYEYIRIAVAWDSMNIGPTHHSYNGMLLIDSLSILDSAGIVNYYGQFQPAGPVRTINLYYKGDNKTILAASPGTAYSWQPEENLNFYNIQSPVMKGFTPKYSVFLSSLTTCSSVEEFNISLNCDTIYPLKLIDSAELYFNPNRNMVLRADSGTKYHWFPKNHLSDTTICCPNLTGYDSLINVTVWDKYSCPFDEKFTILLNCDTIIPEKNILTLDTIVKKQAGIKLIPEFGEVDSSWYPAENLSCNTCREPIANPDNSTIYSVRLKDEFGCTHQETFKIIVELFVPNVITPNGDGKNDRFKIVGLPDNTILRVYTKNGLQLYTAKPYNESNLWEGTDNNGNLLETGNYWYVLENPAAGLLLKGYVFLLR
jgi:gliding motility-associated-like protein